MGNKTELITDFICVARSGHTADKRYIDPQDLKDMAESYDPETYTAVLWFEHWRWQNFGRVVEVKAETEDEIVKLYARIAPSVSMIEMNKKNQGLFTSIEITENFANTGKAYLTGLAFTDSPASLGTTQLHFSKRIGDDSVQLGNCEPVNFIIQPIEPAEEELNQFYKFFKNLFYRVKTEPNNENQNLSNNNNNNDEENPMDKQQFSELIAAVNGLGEKIDKHFTAVNPPPETEPKPQAEQNLSDDKFNQLSQKIDALDAKFNALSQEATPTPTGALVPQDNAKYNVGGVTIDLTQGI